MNSRPHPYAGRHAPAAVTIIAVAVAAALAPRALTTFEYRGLLVTTAIYAIMALSLAYIMGQTGQWSFGHQAFLGIGAYGSALASLRLDVPVLAGFLIAFMAAGVSGLIIGYIALSRTRGMYLAIVTVAFGVMLYLVGLNWYQVTGGPQGLLDLPWPHLGSLAFDDDTSYYYLALGILGAVALFLSRLSDSRRGLALRALRNNEPLARSVGISPLSYYVTSFSIGSALAGLAGAMLVHYLGSVSPAVMSFNYLFIMLTMVILGGMGTIAGPIIGAVIVVWVPALLEVSDSTRALIFSLMIAVVFPLLPGGLYPAALTSARRARERINSRSSVG